MLKRLNDFILYVPLPATIILSLSRMQWQWELLTLTLSSWIVFVVAWCFFTLLGKQLGWEKKLVGCLILTAGLGNTSFVGYPVIQFLYGSEALKYAIFVDQPGTFLVCSSIGLWILAFYSHEKVPTKILVQRVLTFPPFVSFVIALVIMAFKIPLPSVLMTIMRWLSFLLAPLALLSVCLQLKPKEIQHDWKFLLWGLSYKLIIAPMIIFAIYKAINVPHEIFKVVVMESAMAPMITSSLLAASYGLFPRLAGLMVGVGVPLSFLTLSAWHFFLS